MIRRSLVNIMLLAIIVLELAVIAVLCCRFVPFKTRYEKASREYSELFADYQDKIQQNVLLTDELRQRMMREKLGEEPIMICPRCGGDAVRLVYGLVNSEGEDSLNYDLSGRMHHIYAGCVIREAEWRCLSCGREYKSADGGLSEVPMESDSHRRVILGDVKEGHYLIVSSTRVESVGIDSLFFYDITRDGVPEVWLETIGSEADRLVLVYSLTEWGKQLYWGTAGHSLFYEGKGYVLRQEAHMGYAHWYRLRWNGGKIVSREVFNEYTCGDYKTPSEKPFGEIYPGDLDPDELLKWTEP